MFNQKKIKLNEKNCDIVNILKHHDIIAKSLNM